MIYKDTYVSVYMYTYTYVYTYIYILIWLSPFPRELRIHESFFYSPFKKNSARAFH